MLFLLNDTVEVIRIHIRNHIGADLDELDLAEEVLGVVVHDIHLDVARIDNLYGAFIFVAGSGWHHEKHLHVICGKTLGHTVAGCSQSAGDMGRELPSEHQHSHFFSSLFTLIKYSHLSRAAVASAEEIAPCGS